ncbi:MAG: glycoside hydrolase family 2 TIM barrel-domain containing protein [Bryobacteraceae bacterium]
MRRREFLGAVAAASAVAGLSRAESANPPRWRENFNAGWLFRRQQHGGGALGSFDRNSTLGAEVEPRFREAHLPAYDDSTWDAVNLPHTWNAHDGSDAVPGYFRGIGWYRKHFTVPAPLQGKRVVLEVEGANQVSEFWVNGARAARHEGGYTSFELDITEHVNFGAGGNVLAVKVDNVYNSHISPTIKTDVTFYGGIYRDVWMRFMEPQHVDSLYWRTPRVSVESAVVEIFSSVQGGADGFRLEHEVVDADGRRVAQGTGAVGRSGEDTKSVLQVTSPHLWSPNSPYLYRIRTSLFKAARLVDQLEIPLGCRWFHFDPDHGFFLNGKRLQLRGTTWHQSYPGMGNALPNSRHVADMQLIRDMGCNFFRTSHYPHDPAVMEACDRLGLLVLEELFVGEEVENTLEYLRIQTNSAEEMIVRDRNHPCVILWGMEGEIDAPEQSADVVVALARKYQELDPTRPATMQDARVERVKAALDVVGLYSSFEDDDRDHKQHPERKYLIEEYSAADIGRGIYGMGPDSEDQGCAQHEQYLREVNLRPWIAGSALWHQFDYDGEEYDPVIPHVVTFGMADSWRIPKDVFYFYQSQWSDKPVLHICGHWTWPGDEGKTRQVKVYSNLGEVELLLDGRSLGIKAPPKDAGLEHPPRVWDLPYEPGVLTARARAGSQEIKDEHKTAGAPVRIELRPDVLTVRSGDPESLAYVMASIVDRDGTVVPGAFHAVAFNLYGPGELLPQTWPGHPTGFTWNAVAGMTAIAFRATDRVGRAVITAYSPGLREGRVEINVAAKGQRDEMEYRSGATVYD